MKDVQSWWENSHNGLYLKVVFLSGTAIVQDLP